MLHADLLRQLEELKNRDGSGHANIKALENEIGDLSARQQNLEDDNIDPIPAVHDKHRMHAIDFAGSILRLITLRIITNVPFCSARFYGQWTSQSILRNIENAKVLPVATATSSASFLLPIRLHEDLNIDTCDLLKPQGHFELQGIEFSVDEDSQYTLLLPCDQTDIRKKKVGVISSWISDFLKKIYKGASDIDFAIWDGIKSPIDGKDDRTFADFCNRRAYTKEKLSSRQSAIVMVSAGSEGSRKRIRDSKDPPKHTPENSEVDWKTSIELAVLLRCISLYPNFALNDTS